MSLDFVDLLPPSLAPSCTAMTVGCPPGCDRACRLGDAACFDRAMTAFAAGYREPDRGALVSLWSMYYLVALIVPATAALLCRDRVLPVGYDEIGLAIGEGGTAAFLLADAGSGAAGTRRFDTLVEGHLAPFAALCAARTALSPRLFWSNAAVVLDWALGEMPAGGTIVAARAEAEALLAGGAGACRLARPLRTNDNGSRTRRVCCLRYRLPGVADCGGLCPRDRCLDVPAACQA